MCKICPTKTNGMIDALLHSCSSRQRDRSHRFHRSFNLKGDQGSVDFDCCNLDAQNIHGSRLERLMDIEALAVQDGLRI